MQQVVQKKSIQCKQHQKNILSVQTVYSLQIVCICGEVQDLSKFHMDNRFHTIKLSM